MDTLRDIITDNDAPPNSRVSASKTVLDFAVKALKMEDIEARIKILEDRAKEKPR